MKKNPWIAAIFNVLLSGLGYIYVGKRVLFGSLLLIGELMIMAWMFTDFEFFMVLSSNPWIALGGFLWMIAFAVDAFQDAKAVNSE